MELRLRVGEEPCELLSSLLYMLGLKYFEAIQLKIQGGRRFLFLELRKKSVQRYIVGS